MFWLALIRVVLGEREQASERAGKALLGLHKPFHGFGIAGILGGLLLGLLGLVAGLDDRLEGLTLMPQVALGRFHQVGDQVVAALELHVDLGEGVLEPVAQGHQTVVDGDRGTDDQYDQDNEYDK